MTDPLTTLREALDYYSGEAGIEMHPKDEAFEVLAQVETLIQAARDLDDAIDGITAALAPFTNNTP